MKKFLFLYCLLLLTNIVFSQNDSIKYINRFGSAFFEGIKVNPAYTGLQGQHVLNCSFQLSNPKTFKTKYFHSNYSTNLDKKQNIGIGGYYSFNKIGYSRMHEINLSVSYKFNIIENLNIRVGASAITFNRLVLDVDKILEHPATDTLDPLIQELERFDDRLEYNMGLWLNYYGFYFGFSYLDFFTVYLKDKKTKFFEPSATYHINTGYDFRIAGKWGISPVFYFQNVYKDNSVYHFGLFSDYANIVFWGITFRDQTKFEYSYFGIKAGAMILKRIRFTIGYEFSTDKHLRKDVDFTNWYFGLRFQY
ncbi:MAG: PorP/SprF family type IX secretion system membrane protein [Bacteroidales bacterium]|nr:PorP/SprF family type IX secretion system membrane protein [Bacteroidales bacterium]